MQDLISEFGHPTWLPFPVIVARLLLAALLGAIVGFEREWRHRPAGLRTHILVCLTAALISVITTELAHSPVFVGQATRLDPVRMIEAVTSGVAFLAAGLIIFSRGQVHGLTTGAGMWFAAAIGLACGLGFWQIGCLGALLAIIVLSVLQAVERKLGAKPDSPAGSDYGADDKAPKQAAKRKP